MKEHNGKTYIEKAPHNMNELLEIISVLRDPDEGCSWDSKQTHESLKKFSEKLIRRHPHVFGDENQEIRETTAITISDIPFSMQLFAKSAFCE